MYVYVWTYTYIVYYMYSWGCSDLKVPEGYRRCDLYWDCYVRRVLCRRCGCTVMWAVHYIGLCYIILGSYWCCDFEMSRCYAHRVRCPTWHLPDGAKFEVSDSSPSVWACWGLNLWQPAACCPGYIRYMRHIHHIHVLHTRKTYTDACVECVYVYIPAYMHTCIHAYVRTHAYMHTCIHTCVLSLI